MTILAPTDKGEFRAVSLDSPVVVMPGDTCQVVGAQLLVIRNGNVIATRSLTGPDVAASLEVTEQRLIDSAIFFRRDPVPGVVVTLTGVRKLASDAYIFQFSNGSQREFVDLATATAETNYIHTQPTLAEDILIAKSVAMSPDGTDLHQLVGVKCAIDVNATQPVTVE